MQTFKHNGETAENPPESLSFRHLLGAGDISKADLETLLDRAAQYHIDARNGTPIAQACAGRILAALFFEASTRTRFSFESAMLRLGGQVISLEQGMASSVKKGESLADTGRIVSAYADLIAVRHPDAGSAAALAMESRIPVINAGDGANEHPTQALADLYTIRHDKGRLGALTVGIAGDLKYGRAVRSLVTLLGLYPDIRFAFISHPSLRMAAPPEGATVTDKLADVIGDLDVLYVTRVQKERFADPAEYETVKNAFTLTPESLARAKKDMILMHPLPRVNEIDPAVDALPQARYFEQAARAVFVRMALLALMQKPMPVTI
ncbi:MAG: aspartate carbamoyltransferase [Alphaproteobacteria bacterium]|nr:aspartate carbamoyltransferase [Alphaproteobacteria bacterium]MDE2337278.1 aspartate carbamoyltransferase [Alphaproteobacteria bacterium]